MSARREATKKHAAEFTRGRLLSVSDATIDRPLAPTRHRERLLGLSATKPGTWLRVLIQVRKAGDEPERAPGFVEADLVALMIDGAHFGDYLCVAALGIGIDGGKELHVNGNTALRALRIATGPRVAEQTAAPSVPTVMMNP